jgi:hypothetical protein
MDDSRFTPEQVASRSDIAQVLAACWPPQYGTGTHQAVRANSWGERKFWQIASQETLSPTMREFMNYYGHGRLDSRPE